MNRQAPPSKSIKVAFLQGKGVVGYNKKELTQGSKVTNIKATTYTNYINQYTARDTAGKGYGDWAANIAQQVKNPSPIQFLINLLTAQRTLYLDSLEHLMPLTVGRL